MSLAGAFTQEELQARYKKLAEAYMNGATRVKIDGREVDYRSLKNLKFIMNEIERNLQSTDSNNRIVGREFGWGE